MGFDELWQWWRKQDPPLKLRALEDEDTTEDEEDEISSDDEEGGFRGATSSLFTGLTGGEFGSGKHRAKLAAQLKRAELAVHDSRTLDRLTKGKFGHGEHRKKLLRDFQTLLGKQSHKEAIAVEEKAHAARQDAGEIVADDHHPAGHVTSKAVEEILAAHAEGTAASVEAHKAETEAKRELEVLKKANLLERQVRRERDRKERQRRGGGGGGVSLSHSAIANTVTLSSSFFLLPSSAGREPSNDGRPRGA